LNCAHAAGKKKWPLVGDVRGLGGMCAIELVREFPDARAWRFRDQGNREVLLRTRPSFTVTAGTFNNVIRILVPLVVTDEQFRRGFKRD